MRCSVLVLGRAVTSILLAGSAIPSVLAAQHTVSLEPGTRIRVAAPALGAEPARPVTRRGVVDDADPPTTPPERRVVATVLSTSPDSLFLETENGKARVAVSWEDIKSLERESGRGENLALAGAAAGALSGGALGYFAGEDRCRRADYQCMTRRTGAVTFGLGGLLLGAVIGVAAGEEWVTVSLPAGLSLGRGGGGDFALTMSRSF